MEKCHHSKFGTHDFNIHVSTLTLTRFTKTHLFLSFCNYSNCEEGLLLEIENESELEREREGIEIENENGEEMEQNGTMMMMMAHRHNNMVSLSTKLTVERR